MAWKHFKLSAEGKAGICKMFILSIKNLSWHGFELASTCTYFVCFSLITQQLSPG